MKRAYFIIAYLIMMNTAVSQVDPEILKATVFTIPESPAFVLLGTNPSNVTKPGFTKDLKLDYILKEGKLVSDLALDVKPLWLFVYDKYSIEEYRELTPFAKALSTLNLSLGTAEKNGQKKFAWSMTMTIFRTDPICDTIYQNKLNNILGDTPEDINYEFSLSSKISKLSRRINQIKNNPDSIKIMLALVEERNNYQKLVDSYGKTNQDLKTKRLEIENKKYMDEHLSDPVLQIGYGNVYNYDNPVFDSLKFKNTGWGLWCHGSIGFELFDVFYANNTSREHTILLSGLCKYMKINSLTSQFFGLNIRYGNSKTGIFGEISYEKIGDNESYILVYGGELRIDATKSILIGLKNAYTSDFNNTSLVPAIKLNWILAGNQF